MQVFKEVALPSKAFWQDVAAISTNAAISVAVRRGNETLV
jgi:hypothetical protein